ncbi:hypothetical protein ACFQPG_08500 [Sphingomonas sp. GCM10030256]|uniref:hypothetical protein n=1 Tax=Sphingomonas sp. GCM10030256 TaxID=3273427 RepID=UPI00360D50CE
MSLVRRRSKLFITAAVVGGLALPALAQESILPPGFGNEQTPPAQPQPQPQQPAQPATPGTTAPTRPSPARPARPQPAQPGDVVETTEDELEEELPPPPPPIEIPESSRRDPRTAGVIDPAAWGYGARPWGAADGKFLSALLRRQSAPLPLRWLHITLRNALLARAEAPGNVHPVDWAAERAWLLLRMGEADAARMIVWSVDSLDFTPKMTQVAVQSALASADPAGLCPLREGMGRVEPQILPLTQAMCAALEGEPSTASVNIEQARRRGRISGIDLVLADKVVGAGANTARAVTVEWEPVDYLTSWRFGLATATGMEVPERLMNDASPQMRAWHARAPLLTPEQRLPSARLAAGLGVFSSGSLVDLYSLIYDRTDPSDLPGTDAWRLRTAFAGRDQSARLEAMRQLWRIGDGDLEREASRALVAGAATRIAPSPDLQEDAANLIASLLAGGFDREAARWAAAVRQMDDGPADRAWAMLALGTDSDAVDVSYGRIDSFIGRDESRNKQRSRLLVAGLAGTGRINGETASQLNESHSLGLGRSSVWTQMVGGAGQRGQAGTAAVLAAIGMQASSPDRVPSAHFYRALTALRLAGLEYNARMIAAEALART